MGNLPSTPAPAPEPVKNNKKGKKAEPAPAKVGGSVGRWQCGGVAAETLSSEMLTPAFAPGMRRRAHCQYEWSFGWAWG